MNRSSRWRTAKGTAIAAALLCVPVALAQHCAPVALALHQALVALALHQALVAVTLTASGIPAEPTPAEDQTAGFVLAGTHPQASEQPTEVGRRISTLQGWNGRVYAGYGDYGANTGPISISPYDPLTGAFSEVWVSDTEAIYNYRPIGDKLFAPAIDRRARADFAVGEPWSDHGSIVTTHAYDMVTRDGSDLWLVGSRGYAATSWRSVDGGEFEQSLAVGAASGVEDDFARFYFAGAYDGSLYIQAIDYRGGQHAGSMVFDGAAWAEGPDLLLGLGTGWRPVELADRMVYRARLGESPVLVFDGDSAAQLGDLYALDLVESDGAVYVLAWRRDHWSDDVALRVLRTGDLRAWEQLMSPAPADGTSLAALDDEVFVGTSDSEVWRLEGAQVWRPVLLTPDPWRIMLPYAALAMD